MSTPLCFMLDRNIGVTRKAQAAVAAIAAQRGSATAGVDAIMLDNQLLIMMAVRELFARQVRAEPRQTEIFWQVPARDRKARAA